MISSLSKWLGAVSRDRSKLQMDSQRLRLVFIHIPKTGGSTVSFHVSECGPGVWLRWDELERQSPRALLLENSWLAGHFDLNRATKLLSGADHRPHFVSVVRHPMDQLLSNLNYPYTLRGKGKKITEDWMHDLLSIDPESPNELVALFGKYEWLLSQQYLFLTGGAMSLEETFHECAVFVYPDLYGAVQACLAVICDTLPKHLVLERKNPSLKRERQIDLRHLNRKNLRELLWTQHRNDALLFSIATKIRAGKNFDEAVSETKEDDLRMLLNIMAASSD